MLNKAEVAHCKQLCEVVKAHLQRLAFELLENCKDSPVLYCYSSDATSFLVATETHASALPGGSVTRRGRILQELLMQRGMLKARTKSGDTLMAVLLADPVPLDKGKKAGNCFTAACLFFPMLRRAGHKHISITHVAFDRALFAPLERMFKQRQAAYYSPAHGVHLGEESAILELTDWIVSSGCSLHDAQNGLKWGLSPLTKGANIVEDLHITIESLRNCFNHICGHVRQFLDRCLAFDTGPYDQQAVANFWQALGVEAGWVDIVSVINPCWREGNLYVSAQLQDDPEAFDKVYNLVLYMLKWQQFSESRWATVGASCRNLVRSLCIGLEEIVALARANPEVSDFHLHGFTRCKPIVKRYACVAAVASYSLEGFLLDVLSDDRIARRLPEIEHNMLEELRYIDGLGNDFWGRLAPIVKQFSAADLKSEAIHCANTAIAFVKRKVIAVAAGFPWKLARGDIAANLESLSRSEEDISDPTTQKIRALLRVGYNRVALADAVALLTEVPWSTLGVEQSHGVAGLHKLHKGCGTETLVCRAMLHQSRHLFVPSPEAASAAKAQEKLDKLTRSAKRGVSARNLFLKDLLLEVKFGQGGTGSSSSGRVQRRIFAEGSKLFETISHEDRQTYDRLAKECTQERRLALQSDVDHARAAAQLARDRSAEEAKLIGKPNHSSSCRLRERDFQLIAKAARSDEYSAPRVKELRAKTMAAPAQPTPAQLSILESFQHDIGTVPPQVPQWVKTVCQRRDSFHGCAFVGGLDHDSPAAYMLLYATQHPLQAMFLPLTPKDSVVPAGPFTMAELEALALEDYLFDYTYTPGQYSSEQELPFAADGADIEVVEDVALLGSCKACSDSARVPFHTFLARLPPKAAKSKEPSESKTKMPKQQPDAEMLAKYPWLQEYLPASEGPTSANAGSGPSSHDPEQSETSPGEEHDLDDEAIAGAWAALQQKRLQWDTEGAAQGDDFRVWIRGGAWTAKHRGMAYDNVMASPKPGLPIQWAVRYKVGQSAAFSIPLYGEHSGHMMAMEWCRRLQHFYDIHAAQPNEEYEYSAAEYASYQEDLEWVTFLCGLDIASPTWERASAIRSLVPTNP